MPYNRIQQASDGTTAASLPITLGATPTAGNLLVAWANSDATVTIGGAGWTAGPSQVDGNGAYSWYKIAGVSEPSSVTFTPSASDFICAGLIEYTGANATATASLDVQTSSLHSGVVVSSTNSVTVTPTTWSDLIVAVAALHKFAANTVDPTAPVWTGALSNVQAQGVGSRTGKACWTYYGDNLDQGQGGATAVACSWSAQTFGDAQILVICFKTPAKDVTLAATATTTAGTARASTRSLSATASTSSATQRGLTRTAAAAASTTSAVQRAPGRNLAATATTSPAVSRRLTRLVDAEATTTADVRRGPVRAIAAVASAAAMLLRTVTRTTAATASTDAEVSTTQPPPPQRLLVIGARVLKRWTGRPLTDRWLGREGKPDWRGREGPQ